MTKENEKAEPLRRAPPLPPIRVDDEVSEDEPHIEIGRRRASIGPPVPYNPRKE